MTNRYQTTREYFEPGTTLYLYTIRNGKFSVHKGMVIEGKYGFGRPGWRKVTFETKQAKEWCPSIDEVDILQTSGPRIWMTKRNDYKARDMFLGYEKVKLAELENLVAKKQALIKVLESVGMEA